MQDSTQDSWKGTKLSVELWDCSGDRKYAACWPAITQGATVRLGLVLVLGAAVAEGQRGAALPMLPFLYMICADACGGAAAALPC